MIHLNEARITYVTFDFHEHWWGIRNLFIFLMFIVTELEIFLAVEWDLKMLDVF
jgi:hypothetical protein